MVNYERIWGVGYSRFVDDQDEPATEQHDAKIQEMYCENTGNIVIRIETDDGFISLDIPITARDSWNGFVESLPKWDS